ncbi:uncharacterized protein LOC110404528 [Numida meleagris]|uniref:uncharacterized protein LOC110404528 n=1 Tax=Numida meleagris TaxID=8996 RepID=UPI000B3E3F12|nr:uncharacterized protein LOC110404528 [Numida meleagris]
MAVCTELCSAAASWNPASCRAGGTEALGRAEHLLGTKRWHRLRPSALGRPVQGAGLLPPPAGRPAARTPNREVPDGAVKSASPQNPHPFPAPPAEHQPLAGPSLPCPPPAAHDAPRAAGRPPRSLTSAGREDDAALGAAGVSTAGGVVMVVAAGGGVAAPGRVSPGHPLLLLPYPGRGGPRDPGGHLLVRGAGGAVRAGSPQPEPPSVQRSWGGCQPTSLLPAHPGHGAFCCHPSAAHRAGREPPWPPVKPLSGIINLSAK